LKRKEKVERKITEGLYKREKEKEKESVCVRGWALLCFETEEE